MEDSRITIKLLVYAVLAALTLGIVTARAEEPKKEEKKAEAKSDAKEVAIIKEVGPKLPERSDEEVDREIQEIREARRSGGRLHPVD